MNTRSIGIACVLALLYIPNAWGILVHNPTDIGNPSMNGLGAINDSAKDNLLACMVSEISHKGQDYGFQISGGKFALGNTRSSSDDMGNIAIYETHVDKITTPLSSAVILFGSAIVGLVVVGRRIPEES
jgi:hypothetical protein